MPKLILAHPISGHAACKKAWYFGASKEFKSAGERRIMRKSSEMIYIRMPNLNAYRKERDKRYIEGITTEDKNKLKTLTNKKQTRRKNKFDQSNDDERGKKKYGWIKT